MPIEGRLYSSKELQAILDISKQRVSDIARLRNWDGPQPGLWWAQSVESYLMHRGIDPEYLPVLTFYSEDNSLEEG